MTDEARRPAGCLFLVVGPSGAGKDSLIAYCRSRVDAGHAVFPRRVITRPDGDVNEAHDGVSEEEFARRAAGGAFALSWRAHGLAYGIPAGITDDLAYGRNVVVNVSRSVVDDARRSFPRVVVVQVTAPDAVLAARLARRGRESGDAISGRLGRRVDAMAADAVLDNSGPLERAGEALLRMIEGSG